MTTAKHTPGPWIHYADGDGDALIARDETSDPFACVWVQPGLASHEDASLIAAAPDLLEACEALLAEAREFFPTVSGQAITLGEDAVKKARGEA